MRRILGFLVLIILLPIVTVVGIVLFLVNKLVSSFVVFAGK